MKITLITSNQIRHKYLINLLSSVCDKLYVLQEFVTMNQNVVPSYYHGTKIMRDYFIKVSEAQIKIFGKPNIDHLTNQDTFLKMPMGDLNKYSIKSLSSFLESDIYIVFGSSYIKGELADFLVKKKAINIHAGVSPYYKGANCNFWALFDGNPHLVGTTVHLLTKSLDDGPILFHAMSKLKTNPFEYTMSTLKSAFQSIAREIKFKNIMDINPVEQNKSKEIRLTRKVEFNEKILEKYLKKKIDLNSKIFDDNLLIRPFYLSD